MKAVVLTYDRQIGLAELLLKSYETHWRQCPLQFMIPRNNSDSPGFDYLENRKNVRLITAPANIRGTMKTLLEAIPDQEWIYWCSDDGYPIFIDEQAMNTVVDFILSGQSVPYNAIKLIRWFEPINRHTGNISIGKQRFVHQRPQSTKGFWHHQFIRAGVLKYIFLSPRLSENYTLSQLNHYFNEMEYLPVLDGTILPEQKNIVQFGEPLFRGRLTKNGLAALKRYECRIPPYETDECTLTFTDVAKQMQTNPRHPKLQQTILQRFIHDTKGLIKKRLSKGTGEANKTPVDLLVCSFGGVGSKCLVKGILGTADKTVLHNAHTHMRKPPEKNYPAARKVIYLFGDPLDAVISFFKRREVKNALCGFEQSSNITDRRWALKHCRNIDGDSAALDPEWNLRKYLSHGYDVFKLEEHFDNWINAETDYAIMFVKYETMWRHLPEIFGFLELSPENISAFPAQQHRSSSWTDEPPDIQTGLKIIYGNLHERIKKQPDIRISTRK